MPGQQPSIRPNTPAAIALVAGLLSCIPGAGIVAVIAGFMGLMRSRQRAAGGFFMAAIGMMLGMVGVVAYPFLGMAVYREHHYSQMRPAYVEAQRKFLLDEIAGNIADARQFCAPELDELKLTDLLERLHEFGDLHEVRSGTGGDMRNAAAIQINALIIFKTSTQNFTGIWKSVDGQPRLFDYKLETTAPDPSTQPSTQPTTQPATQPAT